MVYFLFRRRTCFLGLAPIVLLLVARPTRESIALGLPFVLAGEAVRIWAAGYIRKLATLTTGGPYALCRNPIYVGMFLISVGYLAMCGRPAAWVVGVICFWLFHGGAVLHEEKLLHGKFGEAYEAYCRKVPRFLPRLSMFTVFRELSEAERNGVPETRIGGQAGLVSGTPLRSVPETPVGTFSWRQLVSNNEHIGAAATVLVTALFILSACGARHVPFGWLAAIRP